MHQYIHRIFADYYQFYIYDSDYNHYEDDRLKWVDSNKKEFGYLSTEKAVCVSTIAHLNDHRLRVFIGEKPDFDTYERNFVSTIEVTSGVLVFAGLADLEEEKLRVNLNPGNYEIIVSSNSLGKDVFSCDLDLGEDVEDEEYFKYDDFEYYDVFLNRKEES